MTKLYRTLYPLTLPLSLLLISVPADAGWESQDSGTSLDLNDVTASHSDGNIAWVCGNDGTILHTEDGTNWVQQPSGTAFHLRSIAYIEGNGSVIAAGDSGTILRQTFGNTTWLPVDAPTTENLRGICDDASWIVGENGTILQSIDLGETWTLAESPTTEHLNSIEGLFAQKLVAGDNGTILRKAGQSGFTPCASGTNENLYGVPMFSNTNLVAGGNGLVLRSGDFGTSWSPGPSPTTATLFDVQFSVNNTSRIYVVGENGTIIKSIDEGLEWEIQQSGTAQDLHGLFFYLDDDNGWAVGDGGVLLRTRDGGANTTETGELHTVIPNRFTLHQNYPNPFNPETTIAFDLAARAYASLTVFNMRGQTVASLINGELPAGRHFVDFDASNLASGPYLCRLQAGDRGFVRKMILMK